MAASVHAWIIRQLTLGEFSSRRAVLAKAVVMAAKIAVFAYILNILSHFVLVALNLLPYDLWPALVIATVLTPPVSFVVAVIAYSVVGLAIYDLGLSNQRFEMLSRTDMLSGLMNRRAFLEEFERVRGRTCLVLFDIDRFKAINDGLGHKAGDDVIAKVAQVLTTVAPPIAQVSRLGGEEFAVLLPGTTGAEALAVAESMREAVEATVFTGPANPFSVTVSGGIAEGLAELGFSEIFSHVDRALYLAKAAGRNRIVHTNALQDAALGATTAELLPVIANETRRLA
ncbi:GGDEF domain-containing protein [Rhizobium sp. AG855]|uniref:GGDEF domain-containing protein n=1 Tax=Rhizobium sp. AG855 TaxID=2183898 RepID=UPI000E768103|nr:GGDEF domain-containing protein [Rhizobium sp. AG855]RKE84310.1 diguanylate cyclase (GGDEF)-like protein [Rhizobium sp. AG855]